MATGSPVREFTSEELDAMAAAELPVQEPLPPNASTAVAASGAPEETGSAGLIAGEGAPPARGPAMGPVAQLEAGREYTTEELDVLEKSSTPPPPQEFTSEQLDMEAVRLFDDPNYAPTRDEYFDLKATKDRLKAEGKLPDGLEIATQAVGGLVVTALDAFNTAVYSPLESIAQSPATMQTGIGRAALEAMKIGGYAKELIQGAPKYRDEDTGEFFFYNNEVQLQNALDAGRKLRPTTEEDLKDHEFEGYIAKKGIEAEYQDLAAKTAPTELLTMLTTGRNQQEIPNVSQASVVEMVAGNIIPFSAGAKAMGLSRLGKVVSSQAARGIEKVAGGLVKGNDALAERFANVVTNATGFTPKDLTAAGKILDFGKNVGFGAGIAGGAAAVGAPPEVAATIAGFYPVYKAGFGVLRKIETGAGTAKIILRESADATNGLDQAARAAVLANPSVPQAFKEVLERPSQFVSIESTPARLAANQALSPQMRALASKLSNPAIVQAVRGSSALATGAVKGAAVNAPFALLAANAGDDEEAAAILGAGAAFGALGGGVDRFTGLQQRRQQAAISDVSRMLVDVELNGGDVGKMMSTQTPDSLVKLAAMQGTFRNALDFVPLNAIDYEKNVSSNGGSGAAGLFLQAAPGQRAKIYINLDAKRTGVEPHEFGHALLSSGALDGQQKYAARAWVDKTYGLDGIKARAAEYASSIIRGKNSEAFPDGNFEITPTTLSSEMENLSQGGLARGDMDGLDWARDEIFAETFAQASQSMDFAAIRRGAPAGENFLTFAEGILGAQARALTASGIRIDGQTGRPLDTPGSLFKENPLLATDKALLNQLGTYINNYRQWANNPTHEKPAGVKIAPSGRASDLANNPQVTFYDRGDGVKANAFAIQDPVTGQAILRDQRDLNAEHKKVREQLKALGGSKLRPENDPYLGPRKDKDSNNTRIRGKLLPQQFDFLNGFMPHIRNFARQFEQFGQTGESMQVRYHAIGSGDSGAFQVKKLGNLEAITREVLPFEWQLTKAGNLNAVLLDLTQFRNRAMRGINDRNEALAPFNWELSQVETDLKQWMDNHRNNLPGENKIGTAKRDAINSLVGLATNYNRGKNPLNGAFGPGSAIKQFRLDRVDAAIGTGRQGFHFDYEKANGNLLPDIPTPLPDLSRDLPWQAMPDKISGALPRRGATVSGKAEVSNDGTITYKGKEPAQWSPQEFEAFGKGFGVRNLGPLSKISNIVDELGRPVAQIPGALDGKFTYYDLLHLKANPVDVRTLPVDLHGQLTAKLARTMTPDQGNKVQKFNGILFGMLSPNSPLLPNEFGQARMRFGSMDEIKKFADLLPDNPTKDQRKAVNERLKKELGFTSAKSGGLGIGISVDLSNIVIAAKMFHKNPDFFIKKPKESWANFVDKLTTQVSGLGTKTASFGGVWQDPLKAGISAMDRHMARAFSDELLNNPEIRGRFEGIVVKRFNDLVTESKDTARKADSKIRRAKTEKAKAAAEQEKETAMQNLPDPTALKADTLDDVLGQAEIFGADRVKDFVNEAVFAAMGSRKAKYQMKDGSVNPNLPKSIQGVEWVQTPKDFQVMSEAYRLALDINAERAKSIGIEIFPAQWTLWDRIRGRVEPHEAMFPGLEKLPALNDRQLASAFSANKKAGYASTPAPGKPWKRKSGINPAELAYFGIPIAAAAMAQEEEE